MSGRRERGGTRSGEIQAPSGTLAHMLSIQRPSFVCALLGAGLLAGCGSSSNSQTSAAPAGAASSSGSSTQAAGASGGQAAGALSADAASAATGDIPDNQVFLVFTDQAGGFSIKYPEGWTQNGSPRGVTF